MFPVNKGKACQRKGKLKFKKAEYLGKVFMKKPKGAFIDPRAGGQYWAWPMRRYNPGDLRRRRLWTPFRQRSFSSLQQSLRRRKF